MPLPSSDPDLADDAENEVLRRHAERQRAVYPDLHRGRLVLADRLSRQNVLDLRRADAESKSAEGAVSGRMTVSAHDNLAGLGPSLLRADDVDDALVRTRHVEQVDAEVFAVALKGVELLLCDGIPDRQGNAARIGRRVVVDDGDGEVGAADSPARLPQAVECLRRRHLMDEVQVNVQDGRLPLFLVHHVRVPYLLVHRLGHVAVHRW